MDLHSSVYRDGRIRFDILLSSAAIVGDMSRHEIDIVAENPGPPCRREELRERAFPGLIGWQRPYECLPVENRYVCCAGYQRRARNDDRSLVGQVQALVTRGKTTDFSCSCAPQDLGQIGKAADLGRTAISRFWAACKLSIAVLMGLSFFEIVLL